MTLHGESKHVLLVRVVPSRLDEANRYKWLESEKAGRAAGMRRFATGRGVLARLVPGSLDRSTWTSEVLENSITRIRIDRKQFHPDKELVAQMWSL